MDKIIESVATEVPLNDSTRNEDTVTEVRTTEQSENKEITNTQNAEKVTS